MLSANSKTIRSSQNGFALVTAILACAILMALAVLVIYISTGDLRTSGRSVGEKKALNAAETGIHRMIQSFDPQNLAASPATDVQVDAANDPNSFYTIGTPGNPASGKLFLPMTGYAIGGGQSWGQRHYSVTVEGKNTTYNTRAEIETGIGYGPIEITTMSR
ncbi:MAG: pilus assembly PilX N-terminal domain-containing protein [Syntrophaceae bacterium]|nr:pilus assembly PilX N-terminal domain-containing protein [Syntrophaceae bacterium]